MPKILSGVAKLNWGFYSEVETRMHLQALQASEKYKVWLECQNKRCFIDAGVQPIPRPIFMQLKTAVEADRYRIDNYWMSMQIDIGHTTFKTLPDFKLVLTLYPGTPHANIKILNLDVLRKFPDAKDMIANVALDSSMVAISLGTHREPPRRYDLYLPDIFWGKE